MPATVSDDQVSVWTLLGRGASELQRVHIIQGERAAAAISRGGAAKSYGTATSNEDAVLFAEGPHGLLLAVADAHAGPEASESALIWLAEFRAERWMTHKASPEAWLVEAMDMFFEVNEYLVQRNAENSTASRTTLAVAILDDSLGVVLAATAGDSHVYVVGTSHATAVAKGAGAGSFFLGQTPASRSAIAEACAAEVVRVAGLRAIVLATDGISTEGIGFSDPSAVLRDVIVDTVEAASGNWSSAVARALVARVCHIQAANDSGDDIAVALVGLRKTVEK